MNRCGANPISPERRYRVGDGSGEAYLLERGDELARISYPSGATRYVRVRDIAVPGRPTPAERDLMLDALEAEPESIYRPGWQWRVATVALCEAGYMVDLHGNLGLTDKGRLAAERIG